MAEVLPTIELFEGVFESLDNVSLRRNPKTGLRSAVLTFRTLHSLSRFQSFTSRFSKALKLTDREGALLLIPSSTKIIFGGDDGDDLERIDFTVEIEADEHWERFMRFMQRYAEANGMGYGDRTPQRPAQEDPLPLARE
jgi:photosystem II Psb28-2 protein